MAGVRKGVQETATSRCRGVWLAAAAAGKETVAEAGVGGGREHKDTNKKDPDRNYESGLCLPKQWSQWRERGRERE